MTTQTYIIVGAGLSGLAAGIRLSQYGAKVHIFESHGIPGGLNGYYDRPNKTFDTGLHALTNISKPGERTAPLNILLRQLRLRRDDLDIRPQKQSSVQFPDCTLTFNNDIQSLFDAVAQHFPEEIDAFVRFTAWMSEYDPFITDRTFLPTLSVLEQWFKSRLLRDMICCPVMYYGNPDERDMDFRQFCIIFRSMFLEGMGRPGNGMKPVIQLLQKRLEENGAMLHLHCPVAKILHDGKRAVGVVVADGHEYRGDHVLSCAGGPETGRLLETPVSGLSDLKPGTMSYLETLYELKCRPSELGIVDGITFKHLQPTFDYVPATDIVSMDSFVVCTPSNFSGIESREVRITALANHAAWNALSSDDYKGAKRRVLDEVKVLADSWHPGFADAVGECEMYTPKTFTRYTKRINGAIYGMPQKYWDGRTPLDNVWLCGADQGYLGIVGAMLSGVTIANVLLRS